MNWKRTRAHGYNHYEARIRVRGGHVLLGVARVMHPDVVKSMWNWYAYLRTPESLLLWPGQRERWGSNEKRAPTVAEAKQRAEKAGRQLAALCRERRARGQWGAAR